MEIIMSVEELMESITNIRQDLQRRTQAYFMDSDFISIIDGQLNAKARILMAYLKKNNLSEYEDLFSGIIPIESSAIEFCEVFDSIKDEILFFEKWNNPNARTKIINDLAYHMQAKYVRSDIDGLFSSCSIKCGDEFYTCNSKRVYVQNVLNGTNTLNILKLAKAENLLIEVLNITNMVSELNNNFINEQIEKCNKKIIEKDYDGAITNARSLIEELLLLIEEKINGNRTDYDGDLPKLYKRVRKLLKMEPDDNKTDNSLNEVMRGFINIISGLSGISNNSSDRHAQSYKPQKRHAILVVNASLIAAQFLIESYKYQYEY
jgi:hypothetical protein